MSGAHRLPRAVLPFAALFALAYAGLLGYSFARRTDPVGEAAGSGLLAPREALRTVPTAEAQQQGAEASAVNAEAEGGVPPGTLARWIAEAQGDDPVKRAAAIAALAMAPAAAAVPVLKNVLAAATEEDKQLTLQSLRTLALTQGDPEGQIRDAVRGVIYHDGSAAAVLAAQTLLDEVEAGLGSTSSKATP